MYKPGQETKAKIIDSAKILFYEKGFNDTTINAIMISADARRTLFFHYYKDKLEIASEIYNEMQQTHFGFIQEAVKDLNLNLLESKTLEAISHQRLVLSNKKVSRFVSEVSHAGIILSNPQVKSNFIQLINEYPKIKENTTVEYLEAQNLTLSAYMFKLNAEGSLDISIDQLVYFKIVSFLRNLYIDDDYAKIIIKKVMDIEKTLHFVVEPYFEVKKV